MPHPGKLAAAKAALSYIKNGMTLGLGTGSTAALFIDGLGQMVADGLRVQAIATSKASDLQARRLGIPMREMDHGFTINITVDGADELDADLNLIKGGGGALLREKIVAYHSERLIIVADDGKVVDKLGEFSLPVEVVPFWWRATKTCIARTGADVILRDLAGSTFTTDNGNLILDCDFGEIGDPRALERQLLSIPGVVDVGLFCGLATLAIVGANDGSVQTISS